MLYLQYIAEANKSPEKNGGQKTSDQMTQAELRAKKAELRKQYGMDEDG